MILCSIVLLPQDWLSGELHESVAAPNKVPTECIYMHFSVSKHEYLHAPSEPICIFTYKMKKIWCIA